MRSSTPKPLVVLSTGLFLLLTTPPCMSATGLVPGPGDVDEEALDLQRQINDAAESALAELFAQSDAASLLFDSAYGYAFFDRLELSLIDSGRPVGVVARKGTSTRTYMGLGTAGVNLGPGVRRYQVVFFFKDADGYLEFLDDGSRGESGGRGYASSSGRKDKVEYTDGIAFYWLTLGTVSSSAGNGVAHMGSAKNWRRGPVPTCRPFPLRHVNED